MSDSTVDRPSGLTLAAVDLGATSGRVILGGVTDGVLRMKHVARFPNVPQPLGESLHWNIQSLFAGLSDGLREAIGASPGLASIGIDSWAVDYGLLRDGKLLGIPHHYRDGRTVRGVEIVHDRIGPTELFAYNGLQHLDFNTVFQFAVEAEEGFLTLADRALLIPDLIAYWLTGQMRTELTNASTTGLLSVTEGTWDVNLMSRLELPSGLLPALVSPGERLGDLTEPVAERLGARAPIQVTAVGSHDTASAVVAVPMEGPNCAFISSGTWSLVGLEIDAPVVTEDARLANFTNEGGVDGTVRFLKNVSGLWLLSESMRQWEQDATDAQRSSDLETLLAEAAEVEEPVTVFDPSDDRFTPPGDMPTRIREWCVERGQEPPQSRAEVVRSILESLAAAYASTIATAEELTGRTVETIHIVGGGSQNTLLCRLTAERTGCRVIAGPVEATAIGNLLIQARAVGHVFENASLADLRQIVRNSFPVVEYSPS
ncbi:rhamnulokinase [Brevibacterium atlanticum]|uniref:rhamnulokinase n=1 Tax=Brevibacterium atlanticum TaxID=2697563 RepID=UPI0014219079|nr:rhamnulokinase family protein [Brevibacterium atlanticum]